MVPHGTKQTFTPGTRSVKHTLGDGQSLSWLHWQKPPPPLLGPQLPEQHWAFVVHGWSTGVQEQSFAGAGGLGQPDWQLWPCGQQVRVLPVPHGTAPAGHPQKPRRLSTQATPAAQHAGPQGTLPDGQQQLVVGSEHVPLQQLEPQRVDPAGHPHVDVDAF